MPLGASGSPGADHTVRLQRCIRDLASLNALVSACVGRSSDEVFGLLLDALPTALDCELVLLDVPHPRPRRAASWYGAHVSETQLQEIAAAASAARASGGLMAFGEVPLNWLDVDLPVGRERGLLWVARRTPFEDDTDRVLVRSAANFAGTAIESANVLEAARRKDEFIATLSHEIRNPLAPLRTAVALLRVAEPTDTARACEVMERQLNYLVRLVDDLMDASRINRGTLVLKREIVSLADVMETALEASHPLIRNAGQELHTTPPASAVWLDGDPVRLAQILTNLLNNASRFTGRGGEITFHAEVLEGRALVRVRDTGTGFDAEAAGRLFEMFAKSDRSPGLGIGLSLSRRLAEMHGGTIEAHSDGPGRGAEFVVSLPVATTSGTEKPATRVAKKPRLGGPPRRVLVADDNVDSTELLAMLFTALGCEVAVAHDGEQAVKTARTFRPDFAVLDIGMPLLDGYDAARKIRADSGGRPLKLVAMTGWGQEEDLRRAREAGFDEHVLKPADVEKLMALLDAAPADPPSAEPPSAT
jgi:signal transduction histidine kinase/ActR/RegA family two-component response regulator